VTIIKGVQDPYGVFGWTFGTKNYWWLGNVQIRDKTFNNVILVYDVMQDFWSIMVLPHTLSAATKFVGSDNQEKIYLGASNGETYLFLDGFKFKDRPIEFEYESPTIIVGDPRSEKIFREIIIKTKNKIGGTPVVFVSIDDNPKLTELGICDDTYKIFKLKPDIHTGRELKIKIVENSPFDMRDIYLIEIVYDEVVSETIK
jgi:hypothetical protein